MDKQKQAWNRFIRTGSVADYLEYTKQTKNRKAEQANGDEDEYRRFGDKGERYGRE